jgi:hypothetical protein
VVVTRAKFLIAPISAAVLLSGCSETVTHREMIPFSHGRVELVVSSFGGALGDERYDLKFKNGSDVQTFFSGSNFSEFSVAQKGKKLSIHLCAGSIEHAEPVGVGKGENFEIVRLNLDWNCADESTEA